LTNPPANHVAMTGDRWNWWHYNGNYTFVAGPTGIIQDYWGWVTRVSSSRWNLH
jgi:hypothetical protein